MGLTTTKLDPLMAIHQACAERRDFKNQNAIEWSFYRQPAMGGDDGFTVGLRNLTRDEAFEVMTLLLRLQQARCGEVMSPTAYNAAMREVDDAPRGGRFEGIDLPGGDQ